MFKSNEGLEIVPLQIEYYLMKENLTLVNENLSPIHDQAFLSGFLTEELFLISSERPPVLKHPTHHPITHLTHHPKNHLALKKGNFRKKILLLSDDELISDTAEDELLGKIIDAVKLGWDDILLLQSKENLVLDELEKEFAPRLLISFGKKSTIENWPDGFSDGEVTNIGRTYFLSTLSLSKLLENREQKLLLWKNLKILFKIA